MTRRKVVFTVEITGFKVHFEGDQTQGQDVSNQVAQGLASLANMPNHLLSARDTLSDNLLPPATVTTAETGPAEKKAKPKRAPSGKSPQGMIEALANEGFFDADRSADDVANELGKKGHSYEGFALSTPLARLAQKGVLVREKKAEKGNFHYKKAGLSGTGGS